MIQLEMTFEKLPLRWPIASPLDMLNEGFAQIFVRTFSGNKGKIRSAMERILERVFAAEWNPMSVRPPEKYQWYATWNIAMEREQQLWWDGAMWIDNPCISNPQRFGTNRISYWKENRALPQGIA